MRTLLRYAGSVIAIMAMFFVLRTAYGHADQLKLFLNDFDFLVIVFVGALVYAVSLQLIAAGWYMLLISVDDKKFSVIQALRIFAKTQIYKYLPTNVIHFVGRFAAASKFGVRSSALSYAQMMEVILMILTSAAVMFFFSMRFALQIGERYGLSQNVAITIYIVGTFAFLVVAPFAARLFFKTDSGHTVFSFPLVAGILYVVFFIINGAIVVALIRFFYGPVDDWRGIVGVAAAGWLLGFVVPGAPGGLGVREVVFVAGLSALGVPPTVAAVSALAHRLITVVGDIILFTVEFGYRKWIND